MSGFNKFDLVSAPTVSNSTRSNDMGRKKTMQFKKLLKNKYVKIGAGIALLFILFIIFGVVLPAKNLASQVKVTIAQAKVAGALLKTQDIENGSVELAKTKDDLIQTQKDLDGMIYLKFIPIASWYYNDGSHLVQAGLTGIDAAQIAIDAVKPYADILGLKGGKSFTGGSAQDRIQTAVLTLDKITPRIDDISTKLAQVQQEIDQVDPNHYPSFLGGGKIKDQLTQVRTITDEAATFVTQAKPLIKVLPQVLGADKDQKYMIVFQNNAERRPTGGFLTAYAIFRISKGKIHVETSNDIYTLDNTIADKQVAPRLLQKYLPAIPLWNLRDTNVSPDFTVSMETFGNLYKKSSAYQPVDGIIALDTHVLVAAMKILGPMQAEGQTFTTDIVKSCDCAQVIYALEQTADRPVGYVRTDRKSVIGALMLAIMDKAFASSPKLYWGPLFQTMIAETTQKHLFFDLYNTSAQQGLEALNAAGQITNFDNKGDYLAINEGNFGGQKSNLFTTEAITQDYNTTNDGTITKTVTIKYKNNFPPSDCNPEHGNLCLNAPLRNVVRMYVPKGSQLVSNKGSQVKMTSYEELGKTVFEGFVIPQPMSTATYSVTYTLPFKLSNNSPLPLMIQKQGGVDTQDMTISKDGNSLQNFPLLTDITLQLNLR